MRAIYERVLNLPHHVQREIARDIVALGGYPFYFIVIIRASIGGYIPFVYQLVLALAFLFLASRLFRHSNLHIARGLILVVFTSLFYRALFYSIFAVVLWFGMIAALRTLNTERGEIARGIASGAVSTIVAYLLAHLMG
jgi:hypothetical protein